MILLQFFTLTLLLVTLQSCSEGVAGKNNKKDDSNGNGDLVLSEDEVKVSLPFISIVEDYNKEGEIVLTTEYSYDVTPIHPSYETKNASGDLVLKVSKVLDSNGQLLQSKTSEFRDCKILEKIEDYERNEAGSVLNLIVNENGMRRRTEYLLSDEGKEIRSQIFDQNEQPVSEREVNWETNEINFIAFDGKGAPTLTWTTKYLKLEMVEGMLRPIFSMSQKQESLTEEKASSRVDAECDTTSKVIKCMSTKFDESDRAIEKSATSFHLVPFDNGFFKYHEAVVVEKNTKRFSKEVLKDELKIIRRYGENFVIKSESSTDREIGKDIIEKEQLYFYDDEGRPLSEEIRVNSEFFSKRIFGY